MEISNKVLKYVCIGLICVMTISGFYLVAKKKSYENEIISLQNQVAQKDVTIEVQKNVYTKLTLEVKNLQNFLDKNDEQIKALKNELKKRNEELLDATSLAIRWKAAYEAEVNAHQTDIPPIIPTDPVRTKVEFEKDFGYIGVSGYTLTNPAQAWIRVQQNRPLKVTLAVSQDKERRWHTYASSSEDNVAIDINLTAVNPWILKPKWYEKIGIDSDVGIGLEDGGKVLLGLGVNYKIGKFTVGPSFWVGISDRIDKYYGASFTWRPFERN